ncbi:MAG TPA: hypothetical protein VGQ36_20200 [Thermoanaerobaculia bacterium]|jgi:hypothetical protein|nr:hypothetical protein [Thermoanaerobaculia bacterium]
MSDDFKTPETPGSELDERAIAKRYGLRELSYPDSEQVKTMLAFLNSTIETQRCGAIPKTAAVVILDFLQATINRQHLTKGPRMTQEEFDVLQGPYYLAARIVAKLQRARQENTKGKIYQNTYLSLSQFIELLRSLLDPGCYWLRLKSVPEGVIEAMEGLRDFLAAYPDQRRKGRV